MLGLKGSYGVAEVLRETGRIDPQLVVSSTSQYDDRVHMLLSPVLTSAVPEPLDLSHVEDAVAAATLAYAWVIIDAPRVTPATFATLGRLSDRTILVAQLTVPHLRTARRLRTALMDEAINESHILLALNRFDARHGQVHWREARRAWGDGGDVALLRNDYAAAAQATTVGKPLREHARRSRLRRDIEALAGALVASRHQPALSPGA
jgi:Flp pilus assembly CpaE family ATPase